MEGNIFSENWYKVASLKVCLISYTKIHKQLFRGEYWYVLQDPYNNKFFRVKPAAYKFILSLNIKQTVEDTWEEYMNLNPEDSPSQDEVIKLFSQLHQSNLLFFKNRPKTEDIFVRYEKKKKQELKSKLMAFLYLKVPLWNPESWLEKNVSLCNILFNKKIFLIWILTLIYAFKTFLENYEMFSSNTEGILSPSNLIYLYLCMAFLKLLHEFGHAMMTKKYGGEVHTMGLMFIIFTPLPFMDASYSWSFRNKWHRILVGSAGMLVELFIASIATIIWANTGDGLVHNIAFNLMLIGSISALIFNGNPLLKFDSYYMLSDYLEIPNLQKKSKEGFYYLVEKYIFQIEELAAVANSNKELFWLVSYAVLSTVYRAFVSLAIAFLVSDILFELGIIVAILMLYMWIFKPLFSYIKYLNTSNNLYKVRKRAISISFLTLLSFFLFLLYMPFSQAIETIGVLQSERFTSVFNPSEGLLKEVLVEDGTFVKEGDLLLVLENKELFYNKKIIQAQIKETKALQLISRNASLWDIKPLNKRLLLLNKNLNDTNEKIKNLNIYSTKSGYFIGNNLQHLKNSWIKRRQEVGNIVPKVAYNFTAAVSQELVSYLFNQKNLKAEFKLYGLEELSIKAEEIVVIPYESYKLPSASLGWLGGGDIQVDQKDSSGLTSSEAFFEVRISFDNNKIIKGLYYNRRGLLKINLPKKALFWQMYNSLQQMIQKRYKI